ncbi:MAG TPA: WHG domain-containing protein [Solirubrobacterales bacterium]|nr:WHG domain-containing protein [Solirubrobacterales bacterium]
MQDSTVTPEVDQRTRLLTAAREAIEDSGPEALRARTITAAVGTSTQALYTHFGGMPGLIEVIVADGFDRFARHVAKVPEGEDPVADFFAKGRAFGEWALAHPHLYRLMFGLTGGGLRRHAGLEITVSGAVTNSPEAQSAVDVLVRSMTRVKESGRIDPVDPVIAAGQFLSATHGFVLLEIAGVFAGDGLSTMRPLAINLMVGLGDSREAATASLHAVETS